MPLLHPRTLLTALAHAIGPVRGVQVCNATHHADLRRAGHPAAPPLTDSTPAASAAT